MLARVAVRCSDPSPANNAILALSAKLRAAIRSEIELVVMATEMRDPEFRYHYEQRRIVQEIALAIRAMRRQAGLTQVQLARLVGVSQPRIPGLEKAGRTVASGWDIPRRVCIALGKQLRLSFVDAPEGAGHLVEVNGKPPAPAGRLPAMEMDRAM